MSLTTKKTTLSKKTSFYNLLKLSRRTKQGHLKPSFLFNTLFFLQQLSPSLNLKNTFSILSLSFFIASPFILNVAYADDCKKIQNRIDSLKKEISEEEQNIQTFLNNIKKVKKTLMNPLNSINEIRELNNEIQELNKKITSSRKKLKTTEKGGNLRSNLEVKEEELKRTCPPSTPSAVAKTTVVPSSSEDECSEDDSLDKIDDKIKELKKSQNRLEDDKKYNESDELDPKIENCEKLKGEKETDEEGCKTAHDNYDEAFSEMTDACSKFSKTAGINCESFIKGCQLCPTKEDKSSEYKCLEVHAKSFCPELSGSHLENVRELIEENEGRREDIAEELSDLRGTLEEKQRNHLQELVQDEEDFKENIEKLKRESNNLKLALTERFKAMGKEISARLQKAIGFTQQKLDNSIKVAHSLENKLRKAKREYHRTVQEITTGCRKEGLANLQVFRKSRSRALKRNSWLTLREFLNPNRVSFRQQDHLVYYAYKQFCLRDKKKDLEIAKADYEDKLRRTEQDQEVYEQEMNKLKNALNQIPQVANADEQKAINEYYEGMNQAIDTFEARFKEMTQNYEIKKQSKIASRSAEIGFLQAIEQEKISKLNAEEQALLNNISHQSLIESQSTSGEENKTSEFQEALSSLERYKKKKAKNWEVCNCEDDPSQSKCPDDPKEEETLKKRTRTSTK